LFVWITRRQLKNPKNAAFFVPTRYEIDEEELRMTSDNGNKGTVLWRNIIEVRKWQNSYLLFASEQHFHVFGPERFATPEEWAEFEALALRRPLGKQLR